MENGKLKMKGAVGAGVSTVRKSRVQNAKRQARSEGGDANAEFGKKNAKLRTRNVFRYATRRRRLN